MSSSMRDQPGLPRWDFDWRQAAGIVFTQLSLHQWEPEARAWLDAHVGTPWLVACSGGGDSLGLLLLLWAAYPAQRERLCVLTYNHGTRPEARQETLFVRNVAAALGLRALTNQEIPVWPSPPSEAQLRAVRLDYLRAVANSIGAPALLQGHQADDVLETFLIRAGRGGSLRALAGPQAVEVFAPHQPLHVRPLLTVTRARLHQALQAAGVAWHEDDSNQSDAYLRNRLRRHVIPAWRDASSPHDPLRGVLALREELAAAETVVEGVLDTLGVDFAADELPRDPFRFQPALQRWALQRWLRHLGLAEQASRGLRQQLLAAWDAPGQQEFGFAGQRITAGQGWLRRREASTAPPAVPAYDHWLAPGSTCYLPDGTAIAVRRARAGSDLWQRFALREIDVHREAWIRGLPGGCLQVRNWMPGDAYQPLGAPGRKKVQDIFIDRKIPAGRRSCLPVFTDAAGHLLWVVGAPPAEPFRLRQEDVWALQLTYAPTSTDY